MLKVLPNRVNVSANCWQLLLRGCHLKHSLGTHQLCRRRRIWRPTSWSEVCVAPPWQPSHRYGDFHVAWKFCHAICNFRPPWWRSEVQLALASTRRILCPKKRHHIPASQWQRYFCRLALPVSNFSEYRYNSLLCFVSIKAETFTFIDSIWRSSGASIQVLASLWSRTRGGGTLGGITAPKLSTCWRNL